MTTEQTLPGAMTQELVTVKRAAELLDTVGETYRFRKHHAERLRTDMRNGDFFSLESVPLVIDEDGNLHNGRHRLTAQVAEGKEYTYWVLQVSNDAADRWDLVGDNAASWTLGDHLRHRGVKDPGFVSSTLTYLHKFRTGTVLSREVPTRSQAIKLADDNPGLHDFITITSGACRAFGVSRGMCTATAYLTSRMPEVELKDVTLFWSLLEGLGSKDPEMVAQAVGQLDPQSPLLLLAKWLGKTKPSRHNAVRRSENVTWALLIKTWNAYISRETIGLLRWRNDEKFPALTNGLGLALSPGSVMAESLTGGGDA